MITQNITLCIGAGSHGKTAIVKCHDTGVNFFVRLEVFRHRQWRDIREPYAIPEGSSAIIKVAKPDKTFVLQDGEIIDNGIYFRMPKQTFTVPGNSSAEVSLYNKEGRRITSASFIVEVVKECICDCEEESEPYVDAVGQQVKAANEAADRAEEAAKRAEEAGGGSGTSGEDGGYYIPNVSQPDANTMRVSFFPSDADMPSVKGVEVALPQGPKGDPYTLTEDDKQAIVDEVLGSLPDKEDYVPKAEFATELVKNTVQENKGTGGYTEEEKKLPISTGVWDEYVMANVQTTDALEFRTGELEKQVGDFDAALDAAIALCDSYIGGEAE